MGLQFGLLHQRLYTLLVIMALITTTATYPVLSLIMSRERASGNAAPEPVNRSDDTPDSNIPVK